MPVLNDIHSQLNATEVAGILSPRTLAELRAAVLGAREISQAGGRHAMGGQQFRSGAAHLDTTRLDRPLGADAARGLLHIEAGAMWPAIVAATREMPGNWAIRQKQTGVDAVTLGGSISANAHGRALGSEPLGGDIENLTIVTAAG
jgi:FAD/FMN-containing dehydrogenase